MAATGRWVESEPQHNIDSRAGAASRRRLGLAIFFVSFVVFMVSPVSERLDTGFSLLTSESILRYHTATLNAFAIANLDPSRLPRHPSSLVVPYNAVRGADGANPARSETAQDLESYQLIRVKGRILYCYPHGGSILALPFVALMDMAGVSVAHPDGAYDPLREILLGRLLASLLMAVLVAVFLRTSLLMLPVPWSIAIAVGAGFGSLIWSDATRALWSQTWEIFLAGWVILLLVHYEEPRMRDRAAAPNPLLLATLLSWMYFVRPTAAVVILGVSVFVLIRYRDKFLPYAVTGALWLGVFLLYWWVTFGQLLPDYYRQGAAPSASAAASAMAAILISPSRGLFIFTPAVLVVLYLVLRHWRDLPNPALAMMALGIVAAHLLIVSCYPKWWGGASYGPRLLVSLVPWFVLLAILGCRAMITYCSRPERQSQRLTYGRVIAGVGMIAIALGIVINARGAISWQTYFWNARMQIDDHPERAWDWRSAQFMAGLGDGSSRPPIPGKP
jgi:hypothetical protein